MTRKSAPLSAAVREPAETLVPKPLTSAVALALLSISAPAIVRAQSALPTGGSFVAGSGTISQPNATTTLVTQTSQRGITEWQTFNVAPGYTFRADLPDFSSVHLARAVGVTNSTIGGSVTSNGQLFLVNPNGIIFTKGAQVDVGGLLASTLNISNQALMGGNYAFSAGSGAGAIVNEATIKVPKGGYVAFLGKQVHNTGAIVASNGSVAFGAGDSMLLDFDGDGLLQLKVNAAATDAAITHGGVIQADGGRVVMSAQAKNALLKTVLNVDGVVTARGMIERNGQIYLDGGKSGVTSVAGTLDASSTVGKGGDVRVLGENVGLFGNALVDASGATGGGSVLIGGDFQGRNAQVGNAAATFVSPGARIHADAITSGDGGRIVVWSDGSTKAYGSFFARGGGDTGNGGFVETSGHYLDIAGARVDTSAANGDRGTWLLDPFNVTISHDVLLGGSSSGTFDGGNPDTWTPNASGSTVTDADINANLLTANVTIQTTGGGGEAGNITVNGTADAGGAVSINNGAVATRTLTLIADAAIDVHAGAQLGVAASNLNPLNVALTAGTTVNMAGTITTTNAAGTLGGDVTITAPGGATVGGDIAAGGTTTGGTVTFDVAAASTTSGVVSGTNTAVTKTGIGTLALSGNNSYTGLTTVSNGTLRASTSPNALGTTAAGTTVASGATLDIDSISVAEAVTIAGTGVAALGALTGTGPGAAVTGNVTLGASATIGVPVNGDNFTLSGIVADGAGTTLTKVGAGNLTLSGASANTYTGVTTISAGGIIAAKNGALGTTAAGTVVATDAILTISNAAVGAEAVTLNGGSSRASLSGNGTASLAGNITLNASSTIHTSTSADTLTLSGAIDDGASTFGITKSGAGVVALTNTANTYDGATTIIDGTLAATATGSLGNATNTLVFNGNNATLRADGAFTSPITRAVTLTTDGTIDTNGNAVTIAGPIGSAGGLTKAGTGTLTLSGTNAYSGTTTINAGTLALTGGSAIDDNGAVVLANAAGATLQLNTNETIGSLAGGGTTGGSVDLGNKTLTIAGNGATPTAFAGIIGGVGGALVKSGTGSQTLSGANTYSGGTTLDQGTLRAQTDAGALGAGGLTLNGGTLQLAADSNTTFGNNTTVTADTIVQSDRATAGAGSVTHALGTLSIGANTLTVQRGANVQDPGVGGVTFGATTLTGGATFAPAANSTLTLGAVSAAGRVLTVNGLGGMVFGGAIGTVGNPLSSVSVSAGSVTLQNVDTAGGQTYNAPVTLGAATTLRDTGGSAINLNQTVDGAQTLTVITGGGAVFGGAVGGTSPLTSLTANAGTPVTINGGAVTTANGQTYGGSVSLGGAGTTVGFTANNAAQTIAFNGGLTGNAKNVTISADGIDFAGGANSVTGSGTLTLQPIADATSIGIGGGAGTLQLSTTDVGAIADGHSQIVVGRSTGTGTTTVNAITFKDPVLIRQPGAGGKIVVNGQITGTDNASVTLTGPGTTTTLNANIVTAGAPITINDAVVLGAATVTLDTTNANATPAGADITISGSTNATTAGAQSLTLAAGTGGNVGLGAVGDTARLNDFTINNASAVTTAAVNAVRIRQLAGNGTDNFGALNTNGASGIDITTSGAVNLNGGAITTNNGALTVSSGGTITVGGAVSTAGTGTVNLNASGGTSDVLVNADVTTGGAGATLTAGRNVTLNAGSVSTSGGAVNLTATTGAIAEAGAGLINGGLLTVTSATGTTLNNANTVTSFNATNTGGNVSLVNAAAPLTITGITESGGGSVTVNNTGAIAVSGTISAAAGGAVNLTSSSTISETGAGLINTTGALTTSSAGGTTLGGANTVATFTATNTTGGDIALTNTAAPLTIAGISQSGGGAITVNNTGAIAVTGAISAAAGGAVNLASSSTLSETGAGLVSTTGTLTTSSSGGTTLGGANTIGAVNATNTTSGAVSLTNTAAPLTITAISQSGNGAVTVNNTGGVVLNGAIAAGGSTVTLNSSGSIADAGSGTNTITADTLVTSSAGGTKLTATASNFSNFNATNTTSGDIRIADTASPLTVTGLSQSGGGLVSIQHTGTQLFIAAPVIADGGSVVIVSSGAVAETGTGRVSTTGEFGVASAGGSTLNGANTVGAFSATNNFGGGIALTNTAPTLSITSVSQSGGGALTVNNTGAVAVTGVVAAGSGAINLNASGAITESGAGRINTTGTLTTSSSGGQALNGANTVGTFNATNATSGDVALTNTAGTLTISGIAESGGGNVTVTNTGNMSVTGNVTTGAGILTLTAAGANSLFTNGGNLVSTTSVEVDADQMQLAGGNIATSVGGTGRVPLVTLRPTSANQTLELGGMGADGAGKLALSQTELATVHAGTLRIGRTNSGAVSVASNITPDADTLHLITGSSITGVGGGINVPNLVLEAASANLANPNNDVITLAANITSANQAFTYSGDTTAVAVGTLDGISGITTNNGNVTLGSGGALAINQPINAGTATVTLNNGSVAQAATGTITAGTLIGNVTNAATLDQANALTNLGTFSTGTGLTLNDLGGLTITGDVSGGAAGTAPVSITTSGTLTQNAGTTVEGTGVTLAASGGTSDIALNGTIFANAAGATLTLDAGRAITQGAGTVFADTVTGSAGTTATLSQSNGIANLGPFTTGSGLAVRSTSLNVTGNVTGGSGLASLTVNGQLVVNAGQTVSGNGVTLAATDATGDVLLQGSANAGASTLTLTAGQFIIQQNAGSVLTADTLTGSAGSTVTLDKANAIGNLGAFTTNGNFTLNDTTGGLTLTGAVNAGTGAVSITTAGGALALQGNNVTGTGVTLTGTGVTQAAASTVNAGSGTLLIDANDGAINMAGALTSTNSGASAIVLRDASSAVLPNVNGGAGTVTLGLAGADNLSGAITQTAGTAINAGTLMVNGGSSALLGNSNTIVTLGAVGTSGNFTLNDVTGGLTLAGNVAAGPGAVNVTTAGGALAIVGNDVRGTGGVTLTGAGVSSSAASTIASVAGANSGTASGDISITATGTGAIDLAGTVSSRGADSNTGSASNAGNVTFTTANGTITLAQVAARGGDSTGAGNVNGGNAGTITYNVGGAGNTLTLNADQVSRGGDASGSGNAGSGRNIAFNAPTRIGADLNVVTRRGSGTGAPTAGNATFNGTVDSTAGTPHALTVTTGGVTSFNAAVGATNPLLSLTTDAAGSTAISGGSITTSTTQVYNDAVSLGANAVLTSSGAGAAGNISFAGAVQSPGAPRNLTVSTGGDVTFSGAVGDPANRLGAVTIASARDVTLTGALNAGSLVQTAGSGTTLLNGTVDTNTAGGVSLTGNAQTVNNTITTTGGGTLSFANTGTLTIDADIVADGAVSQSGAGAVTIVSRNITTTGDAVSFAAPVTLGGAGTTSIGTTSGGAAGNAITFGNTIGGSGAQSLTLDAGTAAVTLNGAIAGLNNLTVVNSGSANFNAAVTLAGALTQTNAAIGATTFGGPVSASAATLRGMAFNVNDAFTTTAGALTVTNAGTFTKGATGSIAAAGGFSVSGDAALTNNVTTGNSAFDVGGTTTLTGATTVSTGTGPATFNGAVSGNQALTVNSSGATTFAAPVNVGSLTTDAAGSTAINGGVVSTSGLQTYNDAVSLGTNTVFASTGNADITFANTLNGAVTVNVNTAGRTVFLGAVGGAPGGALASLTTDAGGSTDINGGAVTTTGAQTYNDPVTLSANDTLTSTGGNVTFVANVNADAAANNRTLTISAPAGAVTFTASVGDTAGLADLDVTASSVLFNGAAAQTVNVNAGGGNTITFTAPVTLAQNVTVNTDGAADNNVTFTNRITADTAAATRALTVTTGSGTASFQNGIGAGVADRELGAVTLAGANANITGDVLVNGGGNVDLTGVTNLGFTDGAKIDTDRAGGASNAGSVLLAATTTANPSTATLTQPVTWTIDASADGGAASGNVALGIVGDAKPLQVFNVSGENVTVAGRVQGQQIGITANSVVTNGAGVLVASRAFNNDASAANAAVKLQGLTTAGIFGTVDHFLQIQAPGLFVVVPNGSNTLPVVFLGGDPALKPVYEFANDPGKRQVLYNGVAPDSPAARAALGAALAPLREVLSEVLLAGFAKENIRRQLTQGQVLETGLARPGIDEFTGEGVGSPQSCQGSEAAAGQGSIACQ